MSEFFDAIRRGDVSQVASLLDSDARFLDAEENNVSALLTAIYNGKHDVVQLLRDRGKKLTFFEACAVGEMARVRELLAADPALLNAMSPDGFPGLGLAIFFRHPHVAQFLIESGADVKRHAENAQRVAPVHAAAAVCDQGTMRLLLERGADPNARQQADFAPLHGAASRGDVHMAELLLAHGADRAARTSDGMSAADVARKYGHTDFAKWIET